MREDNYEPLFRAECVQCTRTPVVGLITDSGIQYTGLCGVCFFHDRRMEDWLLWNELREDTE